MKINVTKDGTVSFTQMTHAMAATVLDIVHDLAHGNAVLMNDPARFDVFCRLSESAARELMKISETYDRPTTREVKGGDWESRFETVATPPSAKESLAQLWRIASGEVQAGDDV